MRVDLGGRGAESTIWLLTRLQRLERDPQTQAVVIIPADLRGKSVQAWLDGADSPSFRTRVLDQSREVHFKDCSPQRYEGCPACAT